MLEMLLKTLVSALDINIDPKEIELAFAQAKLMVPDILAKVKELDERSQRIETLLTRLTAEKESI